MVKLNFGDLNIAWASYVGMHGCDTVFMLTKHKI